MVYCIYFETLTGIFVLCLNNSDCKVDAAVCVCVSVFMWVYECVLSPDTMGRSWVYSAVLRGLLMQQKANKADTTSSFCLHEFWPQLSKHAHTHAET